MTYLIKAMTNNDIISFIGGEDGCSYMMDEKEAWTFDSPEEAINHLQENFEVTQQDTNKYQHAVSLLPTMFLIEITEFPQ